MERSMSRTHLQGQHIGVVGLGTTGVAVARFCALHGATVTVFDEKPPQLLEKSIEALQGVSVSFRLGSIESSDLTRCSLILLSPGIPPTLPAIQRARQLQVPIFGELEFASRYIQAPIVGITGTNGKSTVTTLCGLIAAQTGRPFFCGGNLGVPLIEAVTTRATSKEGIVVCEMSSFQLETATSLHCSAATILNITPDHLDRYPSFLDYANAKARIAHQQTRDDVLVLNAEDPMCLSIYRQFFSSRSVLFFSSAYHPESIAQTEVPIHGFIENDHLVVRLTHPDLEEKYPISEFQLVGRHNLENALAACLLMRASRLASYLDVRTALQAFRALPHRMEKIAEIRGISYYDDSKGTNVDASAKSLDGFPAPFALIAGGRDKGAGYLALSDVLLRNQVRIVVLIGEAAPLIDAGLDPSIPRRYASTLEEAVHLASEHCRKGDAVVLSPACSSYDMFENYVHRAQIFRRAVHIESTRVKE